MPNFVKFATSHSLLVISSKQQTANSKQPKNGFTLIELLVAITIVAILSIIGLTIYKDTIKNAKDTKIKQDIDAIAIAYEQHYNPITSRYPPLENGWFANGIPTPPQGGTYENLLLESSSEAFNICGTLLSDGRRHCKRSVYGTITDVTPPPAGLPPPAADPPPPPPPVTRSFTPTSGSGTITGGTLVDDGFTVDKVVTQNCAMGTCTSANSWNYGFNDALNVDTKVELAYDLSSLGITGSRITNLTLDYGGCWHGGSTTARACGNTDNPEFDSIGGSAVFEILNGTTWEPIGNTINLGTNLLSEVDAYSTYTRIKLSGFSNNHLQSGIVKIRIRTTGSTTGLTNEVQQVIDFARITVTYNP